MTVDLMLFVFFVLIVVCLSDLLLSLGQEKTLPRLSLQ